MARKKRNFGLIYGQLKKKIKFPECRVEFTRLNISSMYHLLDETL